MNLLTSFYPWYSKVGFTYYMDGAGVWYVKVCLKQGDQVILNLVFSIGHKSQSVK